MYERDSSRLVEGITVIHIHPGPHANNGPGLMMPPGGEWRVRPPAIPQAHFTTRPTYAVPTRLFRYTQTPVPTRSSIRTKIP